MSYFLIVYDRASGKLLVLKEFSSMEEATRERFAREMSERERPEIEVVVLGASSLETIKRTHARYFQSLGELVARLSETVRKA